MTKSELNDFMWLIRDYTDIFKIYKKETIIDATFADNDIGDDIVDDDEESIQSFLVKNYSRINFKKFLLLTLYRLNDYNVVMRMEVKYNLLSNLIKYAKTKISENDETIVYFGSFTRDLEYKIVEVNAKKYLYGHKDYLTPQRKFVLDKWYEEMLATLEWGDIPFIIDNEKLSRMIGTATLFEACNESGYNYRYIIENMTEIMEKATKDFDFSRQISKQLQPVILTYRLKNKVKERNLYFMSLYRTQEDLKTVLDNPEILAKATPENLIEMADFAEDVIGYLLKVTDGAIIKINDENVKIILTDYIEECKQIYSKIAMGIVNNHPEEKYNFRLLKFLNDEDFETLLESCEDQDDREYIYFTRYISGLIPYKEMEEKVKDPEKLVIFRTLALFYKLTDAENVPNIEGKNSNEILDIISQSENFFRKSLKDEQLYEILNDDYKRIFMLNSIYEFQNNGEHAKTALENLQALYENGYITEEDLIEMYSKYDLEFSKIESVIGEENLRSLFNSKDLVDIIKKILDFKNIEELSEEDKKQFDILSKRYEFYAKIYSKFGLIETKQEDLINELDDLIYSDDIFRKFYIDGFFSIETVYGFNEELAKRIYNENMLRDVDIKYMILNSDVELKLGDLINLHEKGIISSKQTFELYMKNRISLEDLAGFAEGIDFREVLTDKDLLDKSKRFNVVRKDEEQFDRFISAFANLVGMPSKDVQKNLYKLLASRPEDVAYIYSKGIIDIKNIENVSDKVLIELIRKGILKAEDADYFFKGNNRLSKIMPYLETEERINTIATVYSSDDEIPEELAKEMRRYLKAVMQKSKKASGKTNNKGKQRGEVIYLPGEDQTEDISRRLIRICRICKEINPNCEITLIGGTLIANLGEIVIAEDLYYTNSEGNNRVMEDRATYIISKKIRNYMSYDSSKSLYENIISESGFKMRDRRYYYLEDGYEDNYYFDWDTLRTYRRGIKKDGRVIRVPGVDKCVHVSTWEINLKKKAGYKGMLYPKKVREILDSIDNNILQGDDQIGE